MEIPNITIEQLDTYRPDWRRLEGNPLNNVRRINLMYENYLEANRPDDVSVMVDYLFEEEDWDESPAESAVISTPEDDLLFSVLDELEGENNGE